MNDPDRNTGRTARMIIHAKQLAADGLKVAVIVRDGCEVLRVRQNFLSDGSGRRLGVFPATCPAALRGRRFHAYFIDHAVRDADLANIRPILDVAVFLGPPETTAVKKFDPTKPVRTRGGNPARVVATDVKDPSYPVVAIVTKSNGREYVERFTVDGRVIAAVVPPGPCDLVNIPERSSKFANIYEDGDGSGLHPSRELADKCQRSDGSRVGVLEYVFEDEELVDVIFYKVGKQSNAAA